MYERFFKRGIDIIGSFLGIVLLSWLYVLIAILIFISDPGDIFFVQKRIGKYKVPFSMYKFRSMKMSAPHDVPTHLLQDPEQYITRVGKFLRKSSLDELPQIWNIFIGDMSIIGPRPALWNQKDLIAERDNYGVNDVCPGLTGWAQINGRDELEITEKARLDGEYTKILKDGGIKAFCFDARCFFATFLTVVRHDGIIEGGTGYINRNGSG